MERGGYIYILTSASNTVLYVGVTSSLKNRILEHKNNFYKKSFTSRYKVYKLVYYETFDYIEEAINREKQIKGGSRNTKIQLINNFNPTWKDLFENLTED